MSDELPPRRLGVFAAVAAAVLAIDLVTKIVVVATLQDRDPVRLFGGLVHLVHYRNPGAAFSLATGMTWLISIIVLGVVGAIVWMAPRLRSIGWAVGLGLILGGALGNLVDRLFRAPGPFRGHVVDFVSVVRPDGSFFPVFNAADSGVVCGGILLVLLAVLNRDYDGSTPESRARAAEAAEAAKTAEVREAADAADDRGATASSAESPDRVVDDRHAGAADRGAPAATGADAGRARPTDLGSSA